LSRTNLYRFIRLLIVLGTVFFSIILIYFAAVYTYPFIIAIMFALLLNPFINFLENRARMPRTVAVLFSILLVLAGIIGLITILVVELIHGTTYMAEQIPFHFKTLILFIEEFIADQIMPIYDKLASLVSTLEPSQQIAVKSNIQKIGDEIASTGAAILQELLQAIPAALGNLPSYLSVLVFSLLGTFFIAKDWYKFSNIMNRVIPQPITESSGNVFEGLKKALFGFIKAQLTLISITAIIVMIGLVLLQVDYAITIAVITGLIDLLPYIGTGIVFIPWIFYSFFTGHYFLTTGLSILYMVVIIQRQMMEPKILSSHIGLDPLATLVSLFVGFQLWGLGGLILGPVLLVVINTLYQTGALQQIWIYIKGS
jgi:sporulation integral membrane protein YtvI